MKWWVVLGSLLIAVSVVSGHYEKVEVKGDGYVWSCIGRCSNRSRTASTPGTVLMGGGTDVAEAFLWMIKKSNHGDFVVIRTAGTDAYNPWIWDLSKNGSLLNSVSTFIISSRTGSNSPFVHSSILSSSALFIAGGDQYSYITLFSSTLLSSALQTLVNHSPIGGTSAGLAVIPYYIFSAEFGTVTSEEALKNPLDSNITLVSKFINITILGDVIGDMHFVQRDRMGRMMTFLARLVDMRMKEGKKDIRVRGIAVDEQTAVLVEAKNGLGRVVSNGGEQKGKQRVYFLETNGERVNLKAGEPLNLEGVKVERGEAGSVFDLISWTGVKEMHEYGLYAKQGVLHSMNNNNQIY